MLSRVTSNDGPRPADRFSIHGSDYLGLRRTRFLAPLTPCQTAACLSAAVALHSAAADVAVLETGQRSLIATDVIAQLPGLLHSG